MTSPTCARLVRVVACVVVVLGPLLAACGGSGSQSADPGGPSATRPGAVAPDVSASPGDAPTSGIRRYVALGDSYTAAPFVGRQSEDGCFRSTTNYPALVAARLGATLADRSCAGASTADLTTARGDLPPQLDAVTADTDLVTLSMGGNDFAAFATVVGTCVRLGHGTAGTTVGGTPCTSALADRISPVTLLPRLQQRLVAALAEIRRRAPQAQILVVGYPQIVPSRAPGPGSCPELGLANGDLPYVRSVNRTFDTAAARAARAAKVGYVDVWRASEGHDICAKRPWVNGMTSRPGIAAAYHPFEREQRAVARLVLRAVGR